MSKDDVNLSFQITLYIKRQARMYVCVCVSVCLSVHGCVSAFSLLMYVCLSVRD